MYESEIFINDEDGEIDLIACSNDGKFVLTSRVMEYEEEVSECALSVEEVRRLMNACRRHLNKQKVV